MISVLLMMVKLKMIVYTIVEIKPTMFEFALFSCISKETVLHAAASISLFLKTVRAVSIRGRLLFKKIRYLLLSYVLT